MKIRKLHLQNIGVFDDETIEFQPCPEGKAEIHIFIGQNGSGKTTILQTLASLFSVETRLTDENRITYYLNPEKNGLAKRFRGNVFDSTKINFEVDDGEPKKYEFNSLFCKNENIDGELGFYLTVTPNHIEENDLSFAAFAYSGYRRIKNEKINVFEGTKENPLHQALNFVKDENSTFTINQWLGRSLSKRALALEDKNAAAEKYAINVQTLEKAITSVIGYKIRFKLKTDLTLVVIEGGQELDFDALPDGLKSLISWIGDLLMRLDSLEWIDDSPIFERNILLFLDEIEVHLHPAWQRKILPVVQKLFKNSQIFVSTHSPFVVNSVDDAWVYKLELENGKAKVAKPIKSEDGISYQTVLSEIFGIDKEFGGETQDDLDKFYGIIRNGKKIDEKELKKLAKSLAEQSEELNAIVQIELRQLSRRKGKEFSL